MSPEYKLNEILHKIEMSNLNIKNELDQVRFEIKNHIDERRLDDKNIKLELFAWIIGIGIGIMYLMIIIKALK